MKNKENTLYDTICNKDKTIRTIILFMILSLLYIFPYINDIKYIIGNDAIFHVQRIYEIAKNIQHGEWLPSIQNFNNYGNGYLVDVFYPSTFLYPGAILVAIMNITPIAGLMINLYIVNTLSLFTTKWIVQKALDDEKQAFYFTIIYSIMSIRSPHFITRGMIGEIIGSSFLPLAIFGIYILINKNEWKPLAIGMTLLAYSHLISLFLASVFIFVYILFNLKKVIENTKILTNLIKATTATIVMSLGFLCPFIENIISDKYRLSIKTSIEFYKLFDINWAIAFVIQIGIIFALVKLNKVLLGKTKNKIISYSTIITIYMLIMTTNFFPWGLIDKIPLFNSIQFSFRLFSLIAIFISILCVHLIISFKGFDVVIIGSLLSIFIMINIAPATNNMSIAEYISLKNDGTYYSVILGEYFPIEFDNNNPPPEEQQATINNDIQPYKKIWNGAIIQITKPGDVKTNLIYYKNYKAYNNQEKINIIDDEGLITVPNAKQGELIIKYEVSSSQKITAIISILAAVIFVLRLINFKTPVYKNRGNKENKI